MEKETIKNSAQYEDEINLKELVLALWKAKFLIAGITLAAIILAGLYTFMMLKPVYESRAIVSVRLTEAVSTPFGGYSLPINTMEEYQAILINSNVIQKTLRDYNDPELSSRSLISKLDTELIQNTNSFRLLIRDGSPEGAYELANLYLKNYQEHLEIMIREMAIKTFYNNVQTSLVRDERSLLFNAEKMEKALELLEQTPRALLLENALISQAEYALIIASKGEVDLSDIEGDMIINQELNPSYLKVLDQVTELELQKNALENNIIKNQRDLTELEQELVDLEIYRLTLSSDHLRPGVSDAMRNLVMVVNYPEINDQKVAPSNTMNLAIGTILGLMLGVFAAFIKHYWKNS